MSNFIKFFINYKIRFLVILIAIVCIAVSYRIIFPKKPKPEKCDQTKSLSTHFYGGKIICVNLKTLLVNKININSNNFSERPYGFSPDQQLKITGVQKFDQDWILTLNNGLVASVNADKLSLNQVSDIRNDLMRFSTYGGVVASYFTARDIGYFYYTAESSQGNKILILEKVKFDKNSVVTSRVPMILTNENYDHADLGGGVFYDGTSLYLGVGKGVATELVGPTGDRVQKNNSPFGKYLKISLSQFDNVSTSFELIKYSIFTTGHKNPQGARVIFDEPFSIEHGPWGGDEVNLLQQGKNYGWNKLSFGYDNVRNELLDGFNKSFVSPVYYFTPSIGASDIASCPFQLGRTAAFYEPCLVISSLREQSLFYLKFSKFSAGEKVSVLKLQPISVERVDFGERIRRVYTESNTVSVFTDSMNIYTQYFLPRFKDH